VPAEPGIPVLQLGDHDVARRLSHASTQDDEIDSLRTRLAYSMSILSFRRVTVELAVMAREVVPIL